MKSLNGLSDVFDGPFFPYDATRKHRKTDLKEVLKASPDSPHLLLPVMNGMFLNVAKELNLPLLIVKPILTPPFYQRDNPRSCDLNYPKWKITLLMTLPKCARSLKSGSL